MVVLSRADLLRNGISGSALSRRVAAGALHRVLPAVYSTTPPSYEDRCRAVVLWKPDAVLSHDTAAWWWGLLDDEPHLVHATVPPSASYRGQTWCVLHRREVTTVVYRESLPLVTAEHCFVDVATTLNKDALERFVDHALTRRVRWRAVARACDAARGMHGAPAVREQLRRACPRTLSEPERLVARALARRNFPLETNGEVGPYYGDLVDRRGRVIVEIDGREFHIDAYTFTQDRIRQNHLILDGWLVLRYSAATATARTDEVVEQIITEVRRRRKARA